jgi:hypothetical protein
MALTVSQLKNLSDHIGAELAEELDKVHTAVFGKPEEETPDATGA